MSLMPLSIECRALHTKRTNGICSFAVNSLNLNSLDADKYATASRDSQIV